MFAAWFSISISVFVLVLLGEVRGGNSDKEEWEKHFEKVEKFKCKYPQPRSFQLRDLLKGYQKTDKIFPSSTVLHRCEASGCCSGDKECFAKETEEIILMFGVIKHGNTIEYIPVEAVNETSCSCQRNTDRPK